MKHDFQDLEVCNTFFTTHLPFDINARQQSHVSRPHKTSNSSGTLFVLSISSIFHCILQALGINRVARNVNLNWHKYLRWIFQEVFSLENWAPRGLKERAKESNNLSIFILTSNCCVHSVCMTIAIESITCQSHAARNREKDLLRKFQSIALNADFVGTNRV